MGSDLVSQITAMRGNLPAFRGVTTNSQVVKSNALARSSYAASMESQRILAYAFAVLVERSKAMAESPVESDNDLVVSVPVAHLAQIFSSMSRSKSLYERVRSRRKELTGFSVDMEDERKKEWETWVLVTDAKYKAGVLTLTFHPRMRDHVGELQRNFLAYQLMFVLELETAHEQHLYEILRSYLHVGRWFVEYDDLRKRLKLDTTKRYDLVGNFKKDVLGPFIARANEKTDMIITVDDVKDGRKIRGFRFYMHEKSSKAVSELSPSQQRALTRLRELGVNTVTAQKLVLLHDAAYITEKIEAAVKMRNEGRVKKSLAGWLVRAITDDYNALTDEERANIEKRRRIDMAIDAYEAATEEVRSMLLEGFTKAMAATPSVAEPLAREGLDNQLVRSMFSGFLRTAGGRFGLVIPEAPAFA